MTASLTTIGSQSRILNAARPDCWKPSTPSAFSLLKTNSEEAAGALLRIMRTFGSQTIDSSPQGNLIAQTLNTLQSLSPEGVVKAFAAEISEGNSNSREFLLLLLLDLKRQVDTTTAPIPLVTAFAPAAPQMMSKLLEMSRDTNRHLNRWALLCAGNLAVTLRLDVAKIDGFLPRFSEALQSKDKESAYHAAVVLSSFAPFTEGIAEVLVDNIGTRWDALPSLVRLGPHAAAAVPKLAEILDANAAKAQDAGTVGFGMGVDSRRHRSVDLVDHRAMCSGGRRGRPSPKEAG